MDAASEVQCDLLLAHDLATFHPLDSGKAGEKANAYLWMNPRHAIMSD
jgi:hypothetical protein